jgi:hypothetical protein
VKLANGKFIINSKIAGLDAIGPDTCTRF